MDRLKEDYTSTSICVIKHAFDSKIMYLHWSGRICDQLLVSLKQEMKMDLTLITCCKFPLNEVTHVSYGFVVLKL